MINEPPYFYTKLDGVLIDIDSQNAYIYYLPEIIDQMNHTISIEAKGLKKFMSFDEEKRQIVMSDLRNQKEGFYMITLNLSDSLGAAKSYDLKIIL